MFFLLEFFFSVLSKLELTFNVFLDHVQSIFLLFSFCFLVYMYVLLFGTSHYLLLLASGRSPNQKVWVGTLSGSSCLLKYRNYQISLSRGLCSSTQEHQENLINQEINHIMSWGKAIFLPVVDSACFKLGIRSSSGVQLGCYKTWPIGGPYVYFKMVTTFVFFMSTKSSPLCLAHILWIAKESLAWNEVKRADCNWDKIMIIFLQCRTGRICIYM